MRSNKLTYFISAAICLLVLAGGCTNKKVILEIEQDACKNFKIDAPSYDLLADPCSGGTTLLFDCSFIYKGDSSCLKFIELQPTFYDSTKAELVGVTYTSQIAKPDYFVSGNTVTFTYEATFTDAAQANDFNHMVMNFNTVNELGDQSNSLILRVQTPCTWVGPDDYRIVNDTAVFISSSVNTFPIELWDNAAEDGDIVSVYLNGEWIIDNFSLLNAKTLFSIPTSKLVTGQNDLVVFAINEGSTGPNTVSIAVNGKEIDLGSFKSGLLTGNAVEIDFW